MKVKVFKFYSDPGHGWLAVKRKDMVALGINQGDITPYSYQRGGTVYLEEDGDYSTFVKAFMAKYGERPTIKAHHTDNRSPIRSYDVYVPDASWVNS